jgi:acyl-coenzyme A thioesterase PaaI-like protein
MKHKIVKKQESSNMCFVCGVKNGFGLHARFYEAESGELVSLIKPCEEHQGYPGRMHGGIAATILDETMARVIRNGKDSHVWGVTLELKTRFRRPVPLEKELKIVARITGEGSRTFEATAEMLLPGGEVAVSAEGKYIKADLSNITGQTGLDEDWFVEQHPDDPSEIELP